MEQSKQNCIKAVTFILTLFLTSTIGYHLFNFILLFFMSPYIYRRITDKLIGTWLWLCVALMELALGIKVVITGDTIRSGEKNLIIMNHRTRLDWMYFWSVLVRQSGVSNEKIVLKKELKHIPGAGWSMQCGSYIFIKRRWDVDKPYLDKTVDYFSSLKYTTQVLVFPEGTNLTANTKAKSDAFAEKNGLQSYEYLLHPRKTGFGHLAWRLAGEGHLEAIYDVTVGYPKNFPISEADFLKGNIPEEVHFHIKRYSKNDLPTSEKELSEWCCQRWKEKETFLEQFYNNRKFISSEIKQNSANKRPTFLLVISLIYWTTLIATSSYCLYHYTFPKLYFGANLIFMIFMEMKGGFELFQITYFLNVFKRKGHKST